MGRHYAFRAAKALVPAILVLLALSPAQAGIRTIGPDHPDEMTGFGQDGDSRYAIPEPAVSLLLGLGLSAITWGVRRIRRGAERPAR